MPALRRLRQENYKLKTRSSYIARLYLKLRRKKKSPKI
jgi:hypothetical protein